MGYVARGQNQVGEHAEAKRVCERTLAHVTEADREYVMHFLTLDLELAVADAALGRPDDALRRLDAQLERYKERDHRLALGLLHETRARIAWTAGKIEEFERSLLEVERWFLPTQEPALIAKCKQLLELKGDLGRKAGTPSIPGESGDVDDPDTAISSAEQMAKTVMSGRVKQASG
jgi:hypothetical protein